jgi:hypothetical protein
MTDALAKLLIEKGVITDAEFTQKLLEQRAVYQHILNPTHSNYGGRLSNVTPADDFLKLMRGWSCSDAAD